MGNLQNNIPENDLTQRCHAGSLAAGVQYFISMTKTNTVNNEKNCVQPCLFGGIERLWEFI